MKYARKWHLALAACALILMLGGCQSGQTPVPTASPETAAPTAAQATIPPAAGFVLVTAGQQQRLYALPESGEASFSVRQLDIEGKACENIIHLTPEGAYMAASTCENQNCVDQGEVTLENRTDRVLGNWVICLPNRVTLELYTAEEAAVLGLLEQ